MYTHIYQNSYVILIITFIALCVIFYIFEIGYSTSVLPSGKVVKKFSWKYPLAISLIVWVIWYFYLFPPSTIKNPPSSVEYSPNSASNKNVSLGKNKILDQRINMINWN